tara:strand:- start:1292 stop:3181 length:1890 start_codon:yes stop_codon:yes gene_type:complete
MNVRTPQLIIIDTIALSIALYISFLLRFEFSIPDEFIELMYFWFPFFSVAQLGVFYLNGLYARIWRYTSLFDLYAILKSVAVSCGIAFTAVLFIMGTIGYPRSVLFLYFIFNLAFTCVIRLSIRVYYSHFHEDAPFKNPVNKKSLLLVGAGKTGDKIAREILSTSRKDYSIIGFVDDDKDKQGGLLHGKKVYCGVKDLPLLKVRYDELLITAPSATGDQMRRIVNACKETGKAYKMIPALNELIDSEISLAAIRDVSFADLLGREEVKLDTHSIASMLGGKRILITGAGGSIGYELIKQCILFDPGEIICLEQNEEKVYQLNQFAEKVKSKTIIKTVLATINNKKELDKAFFENRPHIVFHAAAYKHVPIQELHPWTAVKTNIGGTLNLIQLSDKYLVDKFVLVSTDKAVNPVNIMGATKRVAEKLIQSFNFVSNTCFMAVRFGNVLGSSGSAIPTFQKQINEGGPITITHPEMTRYFMSLQEASQLILQCGSLGKDGEIFLLEMGKPIKIVEIAKDLIRLSGLEPEIDIPIVYTGLRPGEKLYEELKFINEKKVLTNHKKIMVLKEEKQLLQWNSIRKSISLLLSYSDELDSNKIQLALKEILPTYQPRILNPSVDDDGIFYPVKGEA